MAKKTQSGLDTSKGKLLADRINDLLADYMIFNGKIEFEGVKGK